MKIVKWIIASISALVGIFALELLVVALFPGFPTPRRSLDPGESKAGDGSRTRSREVGCNLCR